MNDNIKVSLDIGTTKICVVVAKYNEHEKLEILGIGSAKSEGVKDGKVVQIQMTIDAIKKAVNIVEEKTGLNITEHIPVTVGVAGAHIKSFSIREGITRDLSKGEVFTQKDVDKLTKTVRNMSTTPGSSILQVMLQGSTIDGNHNTLNPKGFRGSKLEADFHVITVETDELKVLTECVTQAGLKIHEVLLESLASALAVLSEEEQEQGVCLIDIGGGTSDIAVFKGGVIRHTETITEGGVKVTEDIKEACGIPFHLAEEIKTKYGTAYEKEVMLNKHINIKPLEHSKPKEISYEKLAGIIEYRMRKILEIVDVMLVQNKFSGKLPGGIVLTGGGSLLKGLCPMAKYMTAEEVRIGKPNIHLSGDDRMSNRSPIYSTSIGLVKSCFEQSEDIPEGKKESREKLKPIGFWKKTTSALNKIIFDVQND